MHCAPAGSGRRGQRQRSRALFCACVTVRQQLLPLCSARRGRAGAGAAAGRTRARGGWDPCTHRRRRPRARDALPTTTARGRGGAGVGCWQLKSGCLPASGRAAGEGHSPPWRGSGSRAREWQPGEGGGGAHEPAERLGARGSEHPRTRTRMAVCAPRSPFPPLSTHTRPVEAHVAPQARSDGSLRRMRPRVGWHPPAQGQQAARGARARRWRACVARAAPCVCVRTLARPGGRAVVSSRGWGAWARRAAAHKTHVAHKPAPRLERLTLLRRRFPPTRAVRSLTAAHFDCAGRAQVCAPPPSISRNGGGVA